MTYDFNNLIEPNMEIGVQSAFRFWRYKRFPLILKSWVAEKIWEPNQIIEGTSPDVAEQGIHGFKTMEDLTFATRGHPGNLIIRAVVSGCDGLVVGTVDLWGVIWDHAVGYRAQFAKPTSFISIHGYESDEVLVQLRKEFGFETI